MSAALTNKAQRQVLIKDSDLWTVILSHSHHQTHSLVCLPVLHCLCIDVCMVRSMKPTLLGSLVVMDP